MTDPSKGIEKAEIGLKWDPAPMGAPSHDLDIVAAVFPTADPGGEPVYVVHFDSRSPDGTITLTRDSRTGQGFGYDEVMRFEFYRMAPSLGRVVVGVVIQQRGGHTTFADVPNTRVRLAEGYDELAQHDFAAMAGFTAATVAEFVREASGVWAHRPLLQGYDADPGVFATLIGRTG